MILSVFWLAACCESGAGFRASKRWQVEPDRGGISLESGLRLGKTGMLQSSAVVKVPPPVGCVKYKAQHIVLPMGIPVFMRDAGLKPLKTAEFGCGFPQKGASGAGFGEGFTVW